MATIQKYDELNAYDSTLTTEEVEEFNYKKYFGEMLISDEEKAKREELAEKLEPIFALLFLMVVSGDSVDDCLDYFTSRYKVIAKDYLGTKNIPAYVGDYANTFGTEIIDATERNQDKDYFSSLNRAKRVAADEANTLGEYSAYVDAIKRGCTRKRWHIISDKRTRHTHRLLSEKTIGIYRDFDVGGYKIRFPKDTLYSPDVSEVANCRCSVEYLGKKETPVSDAKSPEESLKNANGDRIIRVTKTTMYAEPNTITQFVTRNGGIDRNYYDDAGRQIKQISNYNHGNAKMHPFGKYGEHAHDYIYDEQGNLLDRITRELTEEERNENGDILQ